MSENKIVIKTEIVLLIIVYCLFSWCEIEEQGQRETSTKYVCMLFFVVSTLLTLAFVCR